MEVEVVGDVPGVDGPGPAADQAGADEHDEGGAHPESYHRRHEVQSRPQHLSSPPPPPASLSLSSPSSLPIKLLRLRRRHHHE